MSMKGILDDTLRTVLDSSFLTNASVVVPNIRKERHNE